MYTNVLVQCVKVIGGCEREYIESEKKLNEYV